MTGLLIQRLLTGLITLWAASVLVFAGTEVLPGDVASAVLGQNATPETLAAVRQKLRLDRPAPMRYMEWMIRMAHGDLGKSLTTDRSVAGIISDSMKNTLVLAGFTALIAVPISLTLGLICAAIPGSFFDRIVSISSLVGVSLPEFFTGALLVYLFAVIFQLLPAVSVVSEFSSFSENVRALLLPSITLTLTVLAYMTRMTRSAILDTLGRPYVEMAILKGVPKRRIILHHAFRNAMGPIINVIALNIGFLVSGVVVVESVFAYPGLGRLIVNAVSFRDIPLVQGTTMCFCGFYICINFLADILVLMTNPRLRDKK